MKQSSAPSTRYQTCSRELVRKVRVIPFDRDVRRTPLASPATLGLLASSQSVQHRCREEAAPACDTSLLWLLSSCASFSSICSSLSKFCATAHQGHWRSLHRRLECQYLKFVFATSSHPTTTPTDLCSNFASAATSYDDRGV